VRERVQPVALLAFGSLRQKKKNKKKNKKKTTTAEVQPGTDGTKPT